MPGGNPSAGYTLKPSLVEWKLPSSRRRQAAWRSLETFLSGMETPVSEERPAIFVFLETFLSGMETTASDVGRLFLFLP